MLRDRYYIRRENRKKLVQLIFICFSHYITAQGFSLDIFQSRAFHYIFLSRAFHCIYFCPGLFTVYISGLVEILRQKWRQEPTGNPSGVYQELNVRKKNKNKLCWTVNYNNFRNTIQVVNAFKRKDPEDPLNRIDTLPSSFRFLLSDDKIGSSFQ